MLHRIEISTDSSGSWESQNEKRMKQLVLRAITEACSDLGINLTRIQFVKPPTKRSKSA